MPSADQQQHHKSHYHSLLDGLKTIYKSKIKPIEEAFHYDYFQSASLTDTDIDAKPMVLLLGQYSVGKTTFIKHLLGRAYPGAHIGPEPTTDKFVAVTFGEDDRIVPGNVATVQRDLPFHGLSAFGGSLMSKFQVSCCNSHLLQAMTLIDSPGVLAGDQQRLGRSYDYVKVCEWFAERSDMIVLIFDAHKLDISDELKRVVEAISKHGHDDKIKIVLNKADTVGEQQLMRVYGALMWSLGKVIQTPEVIRVYIGSFRENCDGGEGVARQQDNTTTTHKLLQSEEQDLLDTLKELPKNAVIRRLNDVIKRARQVKVHAYILSHLRDQMPMMFGKAAKQEKLVKNLHVEFTAVQRQHGLPVGDFPEFERYQERLRSFDFDQIPRLSNRAMQALQTALTRDLPGLMEQFPQQPLLGINKVANPFTGELAGYTGSCDLSYTAIDHEAHRRLYLLLADPRTGLVDGVQARLLLSESRLPEQELGRIWALADHDRDGRLDFDDFSIAVHLVKVRLLGHALPQVLPDSIRPTSGTYITTTTTDTQPIN
jgi:EH domain-containing protein 3/EH domain-containing protein 1